MGSLFSIPFHNLLGFSKVADGESKTLHYVLCVSVFSLNEGENLDFSDVRWTRTKQVQ